MKVAQTFPENQWAAHTFHKYVDDEMKQMKLDAPEFRHQILSQLLYHAIPAGNA